MGKDKVHDQASETEAVDGIVVVDGPEAVAVLFTPGAARETAARLCQAAEDAAGQTGSCAD